MGRLFSGIDSSEQKRGLYAPLISSNQQRAAYGATNEQKIAPVGYLPTQKPTLQNLLGTRHGPSEIMIPYLGFTDLLNLCQALAPLPLKSLHGLPVELIWKQLQLQANAILGTEISAATLCSERTFEHLYLSNQENRIELANQLEHWWLRSYGYRYASNLFPMILVSVGFSGILAAIFLVIGVVLASLPSREHILNYYVPITTLLWLGAVGWLCKIIKYIFVRDNTAIQIQEAKETIACFHEHSFTSVFNSLESPIFPRIEFTSYQKLKDYYLQLTQALTEKINLIREQARVKVQEQQRECKPDVIIEIRPNRIYCADEIVSSILQPYLTTLTLFSQKSSAVVSPLLEQLIRSTKKLLDRPWFDLAQSEFCNSLAAALNKITNTPTPVFQNHALSTTFPVTTTPLRHVADPTKNLAPLDVSEEKINRLCEDPEVQKVTEQYFSKFRISGAAG